MNTLIEKLEQRKQDFEAQFVSDFWILEGLDKAIDIVKQTAIGLIFQSSQ